MKILLVEALAVMTIVLSAKCELEAEELKRIKSLLLNEGELGRISCPKGQVLRIKTAQYRLVDRKSCPDRSVTTCRNTCPGAFISNNLAKRCDLKRACPIKARSSDQRDSCSDEPEPLAVLYTCNDQKQAQTTGNPAETFMAILQSPICNFRQVRRYCSF